MKYSLLGKTGLKVSRLSFGASSLGGVFHPVSETDAIASVHVALDLGINFFDVAPAYGGTRSETVLGKALRGMARDRYFLSTKVGKYTDPNNYGNDTLDYSRARIRASLDESAARLGVEYFDIIHIHDIEYQDRKYTEWALTEGYESVQELKQEGRIGGVSFGIYPMDLWKRIFASFDIDAALVHNHYCLNDTQLLDLLPMAKAKGIGIVNGSPFSSGLLTNRGPAAWHPANAEERARFHAAAEFCQNNGSSISRLALQFASQNVEVPTTLFSSANPAMVRQNVESYEEPYDPNLVAEVRKILAPDLNNEWNYR
jgi:L-galactose dehydrogenase